MGTIVLWSNYGGAAIPSGWALCDGQAGRPDLRNRFVVGSGTSYPFNSVGGQESVTPSGTIGGTSLNSSQQSSFSSRGASTNSCGGKSGRSCNYSALNAITSYGGPHTHTLSMNSVNTNPPYISLYYIIKIS